MGGAKAWGMARSQKCNNWDLMWHYEADSVKLSLEQREGSHNVFQTPIPRFYGGEWKTGSRVGSKQSFLKIILLFQGAEAVGNCYTLVSFGEGKSSRDVL